MSKLAETCKEKDMFEPGQKMSCNAKIVATTLLPVDHLTRTDRNATAYVKALAKGKKDTADRLPPVAIV